VVLARRRAWIRAAAAFAVFATALGRETRVFAGDYQIIVNASNPVKALTVDEVSKLFTKKVVKWENGVAAAPVDLVAKSPVRAAFTTAVHGKDVQSIVAFWQQQIFSGGAIPPPEKATDAAVIAYVKANAGGVGYISAGAAAEGVKVVALH